MNFLQSLELPVNLLINSKIDRSLLNFNFNSSLKAKTNVDLKPTINILNQINTDLSSNIKTDYLTEKFIEHNLEINPINPHQNIENLVPQNAFTGDTDKNISTFGDDDRVLAGNTDWDQKIAFITVEDSDGNSSGFTGALISPFHILTVAHGIYDKNTGFVDTDTIKVSLGQDGTKRHYGTANAVSYKYFTGYTNDSNWRWDEEETEWRPKSNNDDMAIITLDRNIGNITGWFGYKYNSDNSYFQNLTVNTAGYPSDLANSWSWNDDTVADVDLYLNSDPISEVYEKTFRYKLDTAGGQSGSPVWQYNSDTEERHIVGVHSFGGESGNGASRITEGKFNVIQDTIAEQKESRQPVDKPDFVDYDDWFDTEYAYFRNNKNSSSSKFTNSIEITKADSFTVNSLVRNNGTATYDGFYLVPPSIDVSFYASSNEIISTYDYHLGDVTLSSLDPFKWDSATLTTEFPDIPTGDYHIGWMIDSNNALSEFEESNNTGLLEDFLLTVKEQPLNLIGTDRDDTLVGNNNNDNLIGNEGNDILEGGEDDDSLTGSNPYEDNSGVGEYDTLTGGSGADNFVLGDSDRVYYQGSGYATITDFNYLEGDFIQVSGIKSDYSLEVDTNNGGIDILYRGDLIGYVSNTSNVIIDEDLIFV